MKAPLNPNKIENLEAFIDNVDSIEYENNTLILLMKKEQLECMFFSPKQELEFEEYLKDCEQVGGSVEECIGVESGVPCYDSFKNPDSIEEWLTETDFYEQKIHLKYFIQSQIDSLKFDIFTPLAKILNPTI